MSIQRLTVGDIEIAVLQIMGYASSTDAPWKTSEYLRKHINEYMQRLPMRLNQAARDLATQGALNLNDLPLHFDMWRTTATSSVATTTGPQVTSDTSLFYLPVDYDHYVTFYDTTIKRNIPVVDKVDKYFVDSLVDAPTGPAKAIEIMGFASQSTNWRRTAHIYPTPVGVPTMRLTYWRIPASVSTPADYIDIDPKYASVSIYGTVVDLSRSTGFEQDRYSALEKELLVEMCLTARSI